MKLGMEEQDRQRYYRDRPGDQNTYLYVGPHTKPRREAYGLVIMPGGKKKRLSATVPASPGVRADRLGLDARTDARWSGLEPLSLAEAEAT